MSIEAFIWNYRDHKSIGFDFPIVREILSTDDTNWDNESRRLQVQFNNPDESVDIFLCKESLTRNHTDGIMVSRPITHPEFLSRVFQLMQLGDVMLFYSDDTTPIFIEGADLKHYPPELLDELGKPRFVSSPDGLLHQH